MQIVEGLILAAGFSKRANTYKLTLIINGKTMLESCIESMYDACSRIVVVGGYKAEKILSIVKKYKKAELIINENYKDGMYSSVKAGLMHIKGDRFFLIPGDYPLIKKEVYNILMDSEDEITIPTYKGKRGHPVLISSIFINEICKNSKYPNLREFINDKGFSTTEVEDKGILMDVDTMEDYEFICKYTGF